MKKINVSIDNEQFVIYTINYQGQELNVAEPKLEEKIVECIDTNDYYSNIATIENKECKVSDVSDLYYYVYGDEENENPTEEDIIESIEDVFEGFPK